jgi:septal ring-binding cell division protein DamX
MAARPWTHSPEGVSALRSPVRPRNLRPRRHPLGGLVLVAMGWTGLLLWIDALVGRPRLPSPNEYDAPSRALTPLGPVEVAPLSPTASVSASDTVSLLASTRTPRPDPSVSTGRHAVRCPIYASEAGAGRRMQSSAPIQGREPAQRHTTPIARGGALSPASRLAASNTEYTISLEFQPRQDPQPE